MMQSDDRAASSVGSLSLFGERVGVRVGVRGLPASPKRRTRPNHGATMPLTDRFDDALRYASHLHREQTRKGSDIPYVSHLLAVCGLVIEHGGSEDQAIAALLHDAAEDQGGEPTPNEIRARYGAAVADIVADCTDAWTEASSRLRVPATFVRAISCLVAQSVTSAAQWNT